MLLAAVFTAVTLTACVNEEPQRGGTDEMWELVREAYIYAFPLVLMDATAKATTNTEQATRQKAPVNQFIHAGELSDADSKWVVTPTQFIHRPSLI